MLYRFMQLLDAADETFGAVAVLCFLACVAGALASL